MAPLGVPIEGITSLSASILVCICKVEIALAGIADKTDSVIAGG